MSGPSCLDLRERFPAYRWSWDESHCKGQNDDPWLVEIVGRHGKIYPLGGEYLCALVRGARRKKLAEEMGEVIQEGDAEIVIKFPASDWKRVFRIAGIRRRRKPTEKQRGNLQPFLAMPVINEPSEALFRVETEKR